jgi:fucose permease
VGPSVASVLVLAYVAFVSLGLPDTVLGVAWPSLRGTFRLPQAAMGTALSAHVAGYFVSGLLAGRMAAALGVGGLLAASTSLVAAGLVGFALAPSWPVFVASGIAVGLGSGAVDAALNAYAATHFAPRHVNWLHACYSAGATLGPAAMTAALAGASFRAGYAALAALIAAMAGAFVVTRGRWGRRHVGGAVVTGTAREALRRPRVWLQIATFFVYTGLEASAGQWAFTVLREARGFSLEAAGTWTAAYWGSIAAGRVAVGFAVGRAGPDRLVQAGAGGALAGAVLYALAPGVPGAAGLVVLGLGLAPIFPMLMSRTPERLGAEVAAHAVGFQVAAATLGVAALPSVFGALADALGPGAIPTGLAALAALLVATCGVLRRGDEPIPQES